MSFPNGYKGVSKLFAAEILMLISSVILVVSGGIGIGIASLTAATQLTVAAVAAIGIVGILILAASIVVLIAMIIKLVGLAQAGRDERNFKIAFNISIFVLVLAVASAVLKLIMGATSGIDEVVQLIQRIGEIVVIFLVIGGIQSFATSLGNERIMRRGSAIAWIIAIPYALGAIADMIPGFFGESSTAVSISGIMTLVGGVLGIIGSILYLVYLGQAKRMLKEN